MYVKMRNVQTRVTVKPLDVLDGRYTFLIHVGIRRKSNKLEVYSQFRNICISNIS